MEHFNEVKASLESTMDTKLSMMQQQLETLTALLNGVLDKGTPAVVEEVGDPSLVVANKAATLGEDDPEKLKANHSSSTKPRNGDGEYSSVPPFVFADPRVNHPHINNVGNPPKVNAVDFERWQFEFRSYMRRSCNELWRIVEKGFNPQHDSDNYTNREVVDARLNATALHMIQQAVNEKDFPFIMKHTIAKDAWDSLAELYIWK